MKVVIIGGRGNGTVIASTIEDCKKIGMDIECVGFLNDSEMFINEYPVLGPIMGNFWETLPMDYMFVYAMSNVQQAHERFELLKSLGIPEERYATIIHPTAVVSDKAELGVGVVLMPFTLVSPNVRIGNHSQMYAQSFIGHDSELKEMVFVANNASIGGRVVVKNGAHIGSNSSILERNVIGAFSIIGLASNVLKSTEPFGVYVGSPAKQIKKIKFK
jgi:acetyltransferase EpsM